MIALAAAAAIVGDNIGYLIGRKGGRWLLERPGPLPPPAAGRCSATGEPFFERHGPKAVFFGRFVLGLRVWASWLAGATRMPWRSFVLWNALGGICWATGDRPARLLPRPLRRQRDRSLRPVSALRRSCWRSPACSSHIAATAQHHALRERPQDTAVAGSRQIAPARASAAAPAVRSRRADGALSSRCRARSAPTCRPASSSSPSEKRERKCSRTTARCVPRASISRSRPVCRQARVGAARVVFAGAALEQLLPLEPVDQSCEPAARQLRLLGQVAHPHAPAARVLEVVEHLVGGHRQPMRLLELGVQALGQAGVRSQQSRARHAGRSPIGPPRCGSPPRRLES